jgi:5-methylcytosine-specific restriction enzyme B
MPTDALTKVDLAERLVQWKIEATNPNHANHYHADLDAPAANYARISTLLQKLRTAPESFGRDDVVVLFGALNSGQRMKNKVADGNPLPALAAALLELVDGEGEPTAKIEMARQNIKYAASNMLGELYGWANAETAPLYNGCARDALAHLGYRFDPSNYDAFVGAHEQFKQEYLAQVGRLRPDLPLNLEIDKVDLKRPLQSPEKPFAASSQRFWKIAPGDDAWNWKECRDKGFIAIGWDELRDLSNLDRAGFEARRTEVQQEHPDWSNDALEQVWKVAQIQEGDRIVANRGTAEVLGIGTVTGPYYFVPGVRHGHRLPVRWDDTTRRRVSEGGWRRALVELSRAKFETIASAAPIDSGPVGKPGPSVIREDQGTWSTRTDSTFSPRAFQILEGIHAEPTKAYYQAHRDDFKAEVEEPFRRLMARVAAKLPSQMRDVMETEQRIFSRFLKNDWGKGGTWDFYWGAFYPKDGKRTQDAQLSLWMNYQRLEYGFYIGDYGSAQRQHFQRNCEIHFEELKILLGDILANERLIYGGRENFDFGPDGALVGRPGTTWEDFLRDPGRANNDVSVLVSQTEILATPAADLVDRIAETYKLLFPLVLLAVSDQPLAEIANYLDAIAPGSDEGSEAQRVVQPTYSLAQCATETGFSEDTLAGWIRSIERKGQAILYGPPGTGKTFIAERLARHIIGGGDGFTELVQFHPAYAYEDFIQGIRPKTTDGGGLSYPTVPGRFLEFCDKASHRQGKCVLIIDEINRANLARVFGELMYLLEYRDREVPLAGGGTLRIPANIRVIGTMNTADRSIALVDHALRRRFAFLALYPNYDVLRSYHKNQGTAFPIEKLIQVLFRLNNAILDRHYAVGITFFLREKLPDEIADIWRMEIEPYLDEYFFDQPDKSDAFRWDRVQADLQPWPKA